MLAEAIANQTVEASGGGGNELSVPAIAQISRLSNKDRHIKGNFFHKKLALQVQRLQTFKNLKKFTIALRFNESLSRHPSRR